jgi:hypothetical protein
VLAVPWVDKLYCTTVVVVTRVKYGTMYSVSCTPGLIMVLYHIDSSTQELVMVLYYSDISTQELIMVLYHNDISS